jgi:hypothetical protein
MLLNFVHLLDEIFHLSNTFAGYGFLIYDLVLPLFASLKK